MLKEESTPRFRRGNKSGSSRSDAAQLAGEGTAEAGRQAISVKVVSELKAVLVKIALAPGKRRRVKQRIDWIGRLKLSWRDGTVTRQQCMYRV